VLPLPIPLSIVPPEHFTYPYYLMLLGFIISFGALVAIFPSLRKYRRKRNIAVYAAALFVVSLLIFQIDNVGRWAMVNISFNGSPQYFPEEIGQLNVGAESWGEREANFNVVINCVNASFQPEQNFIHVNDTAVKVPFLLQTHGLPRSADSRSVSFAIDEGVAGFSFDVSSEQQGTGRLVVGSCDYFLSYAWNGTQNSYVMNCSATVT
jgi:hypothetical protein